MRMRSALAIAITTLGLVALPAAAQAAPAAKTPAQRCADIHVYTGIFVIHGDNELFCLVKDRPERYAFKGATSCGPLSKGGTGYGITSDNKRISCNGWINFARQDMKFSTK
ncbi:hypothetical protein [Allokutzneria oryzae]|uniref:Uncharacterized protein n=1 Tax=Allokutzneria oryzae TaxID=1378989 RepID=A0ABV5ZXX7_9PSEU